MKEKGKKWDNKFVGGKAHKELVGRERKREITELTRGQAGVCVVFFCVALCFAFQLCSLFSDCFSFVF